MLIILTQVNDVNPARVDVSGWQRTEREVTLMRHYGVHLTTGSSLSLTAKLWLSLSNLTFPGDRHFS